jgi:hypothetical protein
MRAMEETRRAELDSRRLAAQQAHEAELAALRAAEEGHARQRAEEERRYLEAEANRRADEDAMRRRAEMQFRAVEEEIERINARESARLKAIEESQRLVEDDARRRAEQDSRRQAETEALRRAEDEARLRAEIEAQMRAEAEQRRKAEEELRRHAEEEARIRAEEEAQRLAAERARRLAEEEAQRRADEEVRRQAEETARVAAEEEARRQAEMRARLQAEEESRLRAEAEVRQRAELEARIRAEVQAKMRAEEAERQETEAAVRRRAEHERLQAEESSRAAAIPESVFQIEGADADETVVPTKPSNVTEIAEWFDVGLESKPPVREIEVAPLTLPDERIGTMQDDAGHEFAPVSVPESNFDPEDVALPSGLASAQPAERAAAVSDLPRLGGEEAFRQVSAAFDDQSDEVRSAAARAMFELQEDRAAAFTRALREATPERRRKIGAAIASSGLANEAIRNLTGESRDKTYDAFSLLFLMSKAGETQPLMRAIEEHSNIEVRLAVVKLLALSGQPDILPAFRRMAVRGSLPPEVRSAVMEAIYQITSQTPAEAPSML